MSMGILTLAMLNHQRVHAFRLLQMMIQNVPWSVQTTFYLDEQNGLVDWSSYLGQNPFLSVLFD